MKSFELYFVGWYKHGEVQSLHAGPFLTYDLADKFIFTDCIGLGIHNMVVCRVELPFTVERA